MIERYFTVRTVTTSRTFLSVIDGEDYRSRTANAELWLVQLITSRNRGVVQRRDSLVVGTDGKPVAAGWDLLNEAETRLLQERIER